ncbi:MAG: DNA replication/repair protein RecF [Acidimicrobiales bacterium]
MQLHHIDLVDFRVFAAAELDLSLDGVTVIVGPNGGGKTSLLEAVAYLGTQRSFRGVRREVLVRAGCDQAVIRADLVDGGHHVLVEAQLPVTGRPRTQVNRQVARTRRELATAAPCTVFTPDDVGIIHGPPAGRRDVIDDALGVLDPTAADALEQVERVLRQRAALLRQSGGRSTQDVASTLDVWDGRLAKAGTTLADAREALVGRLQPLVTESYAALAGPAAAGSRSGSPTPAQARITYRRSWTGDLLHALEVNRRDDLRRGTTSTGPHRDDLVVNLGERDARTQASQGEQRCLALALRLAVHRLVTAAGSGPPILLLDDVFSELDPDRARALVTELPAGQALLTTAASLPPGMMAAAVVDVRDVGHRTEEGRAEGRSGPPSREQGRSGPPSREQTP